jgi:intein/homing endonuclease
MPKLIRWELKHIAEMIVLMLLNKYDFVCMVDGNRGCLIGDTLIKTPLGNKKISKIDDISILNAYDFKREKEIETTAKKIDSGIKDVYEIITEDGRIIKATLNHIFFVKRNNKVVELPLKDIKEGEELICIK